MIDLAAANASRLILVGVEGEMLRQRTVILFGTVVVEVDGHEVTIPEAATRKVLSRSMTYRLISFVGR